MRKTRGMGLLRVNDARKKANRGTAAAGRAYSEHGRNIDAQGSLRLRILPKIRERGVTMARIKVSGTNLTKHFTFAEYGKNQTGTVKLTAAAILQAQCMEEFRQWLGKPMQINSWFRTAAYNKKIGGNAKSSHLRGCAADWSNPGVSAKDFIRYAKKWKEICETHGVVGEAGLYTWGIHLGSSISYSKVFYHWDARSGRQKNLPFTL